MIYLDHHAATPLTPGVIEEIAAAHQHAWANPSSVHVAGRASRALLERARERIARAIGSAPADVVLTGGGTEACNLGIFGLVEPGPPGHVVASSIEHPAVTEAVRGLEARGWRVTWLGAPFGRGIAPDELDAALEPDTRLVALQWVNHETGTVLPVSEYGVICRERRVRLFVDATQALGKLVVDVRALGADAAAFASHKIGGPAGAGALWVRRGLDPLPLLVGGEQERGRRAGTPDVIAQVGFGAACARLLQRLDEQPRLAGLRDRLEAELIGLGAERNAPESERVATATNLYFAGRRTDVLVAALDVEGVAASSGAACSSGKSEPSPVLLAMHADEPARANASIRFSFGPENVETDVDFTVDCLQRILGRRGR